MVYRSVICIPTCYLIVQDFSVDDVINCDDQIDAREYHRGITKDVVKQTHFIAQWLGCSLWRETTDLAIEL